MNSPTVSECLPPDEHLEDAIIVAGLALMCAKSPDETRAAYQRLQRLKAHRDELRRAAA